MLGANDDIPDLIQDVFARFFAGIRNLRSPESLRFFIIGIAFRRGREEIRRRHTQRSFRPMVETHFRHRDDGTGPERGAATAAVGRLLAELGRDGQIYVLRVLHGCDLPEISQLMNLSISTVRRRFNRAQRWMEIRTQDRVAGAGGPFEKRRRRHSSGTDTQARLAQLSSPSSAS